MTKEEIVSILTNATSKANALKLLGYQVDSMSGTKAQSILDMYCEKVGIDSKMISINEKRKRRSHLKRIEFESNPPHCLECGKEISWERRGAKFCNSSCAAKYNNTRRILSDETKEKISSSLHTHFEKCSTKSVSRICIVCGKEFEPEINEKGQRSGSKACSDECKRELKSRAGKRAIMKCKEKGTWKPWQSRNIISYAEKFWTKVLENNSIIYQRELHLDRYFLDFYIEKNGQKIDLEIDGHQHFDENGRLEHDMIRDEFVRSKGITVYRIRWNNIKSQKGKEDMRRKIEKFVEFYNSL